MQREVPLITPFSLLKPTQRRAEGVQRGAEHNKVWKTGASQKACLRSQSKSLSADKAKIVPAVRKLYADLSWIEKIPENMICVTIRGMT